MTAQTIPLSQLVKAESNVRTSPPSESEIASLADSIAERGLINALVGYQKSKKRVAIHAGSRRLSALQLLKKQNRLPDSLKQGIPVVIRDDDRVAQVATSFDENNERVSLTVMDECRSFQQLSDAGLSVVEIANKFHTTERVVNQRLALTNVAQEIINAFEANEIGLQQLQAYTIEPDAAKQLRVFNAHGRSVHSRTIRRALTEEETPVSSSTVKFIGLENYVKAGGAVRADLFDDDEKTITNTDLLLSLCMAKLTAEAKSVEANGWKWVEPVVDVDYQQLHAFSRAQTVQPDLSEDEQSTLNALENRICELSQEIDDLYSSDDQDSSAISAAESELDDLEEQAEALSAEVFTDETKQQSGVIVTIARDGSLKTYEGLIKPEDKAGYAISSGAKDGTEDQIDKSNALSSSLCSDINDALTAAVQRDIAVKPDIAFLLSTAFLVKTVFGDTVASTNTLVYAGNRPHASSAAFQLSSDDTYADTLLNWQKRLPATGEDLIEGLSDWKMDELRELHAFCAATLYTRDAYKDGSIADARGHDILYSMTASKPIDHLSPDETFFARMTKPQLITSIQAMGHEVPAKLAKGKKSALVSMAVSRADGAWLPHVATYESNGPNIIRKSHEPAEG